jgi:hypothetical protein
MTTKHIEAQRFYVQSGTRSLLVDLEEWEGRGECGCEHFHYKVSPEYKNGNPADLSCKHILAVKRGLK